MNIRDEFIEIYNKNIKREGAKELLDFLMSSDFCTAPASSKFHSCHEGGLLEHSVNCYYRFKKNIINEYGENYTDKISDESIAIIALLHDICKVNTYKVEMRNTKVDGAWVQVPYFTVEDNLPYGHGEKSVYMISGFMKLTREESMAINWHMGGFDSRVMGGSYSLSGAFYKYPIALLFHLSDVMATYLDEKIG
ncbi:MAG: hydrolase [Clostridiales bacterium]|nr:hydrolase [Clostridiales bacterium]